MKLEKRVLATPVSKAQLALGSAQSGYRRVPFWFESATGNNFAWLHLPCTDSGHATGVIICHPLGYEYTHSHRSTRHLADQLALHGYPTLRFDLHGMGDSSGDLLAEDLLQRWVADINAAINVLKSSTQVSSISLFGIRMGATMAVKVTEHTSVEHLLLWNPVASGRRYVREMQALAWMADRDRSVQEDYTESAGFIMTTAAAAQIKEINIGKQTCKVDGKVLLVQRDDIGADTNLAAELRQQGITVDAITATGYADMMAEPQATKVPLNAIASIIDWMDQNTPAGSLSYTGDTVADVEQEVTLTLQNDIKLVESVCLAGGGSNKLFGILCRPAKPVTRNTPLIILLNSGSVHHVGPNRLYVELSRSLGAAGFSSLRIDLSNLGDSVVGQPADENHCYPDHANAEVSAVLDSVVADMGFEQVILAGICSGAHTAFHAGLNHAAVCESIIINPLTFYWEEGMSLEIPRAHATIKDAKYYEGAMKDKRKWLKLLKGQVEFGYILRFVGKRVIEQMVNKVRRLRAKAGFEKPARLCLDLIKYKEARRHLSFFFSTSDPGYDILMSESPQTAKQHIKRGDIDVCFIEAADHTFSAKDKRDELIAQIIAHVELRYKKRLQEVDCAANT